ncbi:uncharacterized protein LOC142233404 [Haematobia irritans]|uniref:uncharacterized protein LOC142233404 n=1 Tax=Haematobia irritans TaxID=7368 RepID=UPI003F4F3F4A
MSLGDLSNWHSTTLIYLDTRLVSNESTTNGYVLKVLFMLQNILKFENSNMLVQTFSEHVNFYPLTLFTKIQRTIENDGINISALHDNMFFYYEYMVIKSERSTQCIFEDMLEILQNEEDEAKPLIILDKELADVSNNMERKHSRNGIILSCWSKNTIPLKLSESLMGHFIWITSDMDMKKICLHFKDEIQISNFIMDINSLRDQHLIHICNRRRPLEIKSSMIAKLHYIGIGDLTGIDIVTESDQLPPRSILYRNAEGHLKLEGYIGNCIDTFASRYNATLIIRPPKDMGLAIFYNILLDKITEGHLDVPSVATPYPLVINSTTNIDYSYPIEILELCYMIPLPRLMEFNHVYTYIIDKYVMLIIFILILIYGILFTMGTTKRHSWFLLEILVNDKSIRVLLGQSFVMPTKPGPFMQYICFLLCYTSLIISTSYQAYLQSNLIHPALERRVETYEDIRRVGLKIAISPQEANFLDPSILSIYSDIFEIMEPYYKFLKLRASWNTHYVYPVSYTRWLAFNEQQSIFQRTLFYYSQKLCLDKQYPLSVPMRQDLPFKPQFDQHILRLWQMGFMQHWIKNNFLTLVRMNYTKMEDLSTPEIKADAIELNDLKWLALFFAGSLVLALKIQDLASIKLCSSSSRSHRPLLTPI